MATYIFEITDYHAIKKASVKLDGITVLSGINGSGKSTIARWLQHTVYTLVHYDRLVEQEGIDELTSTIYRLINFINSLVGTQQSLPIRNLYDTIKYHQPNTFNEVESVYKDICGMIVDLLTDYLSQVNDPKDFYRIVNYLRIPFENNETISTESFSALFAKSLAEDLENIRRRIQEKKANRTDFNFSEKIFSITDNDIEENEINLQFWEDGVKLLGDKDFKIPLMLSRVIYINTQEIGNAFKTSDIRNRLYRMLSESSGALTDESTALIRMIRGTIGGEVQVRRSKIIPSQRASFRFVSRNGKAFNIKGAATGIISFSYILQLLQNGWLDENTLLIIDEPESHLHPQWIVEYARILVLIQKYLGTKILVSSHNPDMVSAIQSISSKNGLKKMTRFYLAEPDYNSGDQYNFTDLGFNIEKIFDSFNIAIDRIADYGDPTYEEDDM
ncbi:MAG: ATP-binding protein [Muribaculaceae bacterium]|nr:ATP-binding protein [Muribaculaceae bacterium]